MMRKRILMVEDDPIAAKVLKGLLETRGCTVEHTPDGLAALRRARSEVFDLLIVDWLLPELDGYKICRLLKMDRRFRDVPILVVTGRSDPDDLDKIRSVGVDEVLSKSLPPIEIASRIEERLGSAV